MRPNFVGVPKPSDLEWLKAEVVKRLKNKDALGLVLRIGATTIDTEVARALIPQVEHATSASQITSTLLAADFPERKRWASSPVR